MTPTPANASTRVEPLLTQLAWIERAFQANTAGLTHDDSLVQPPSGGNCLNWVAGHIVAARNSIHQLLGKDPIWDEGRAARYRRGSEPILGPGDGVVPFEAIQRDHRDSLATIVAALREISDESLSAMVPWFGEESSRVAAIGFMIFHESYHTGQTGPLRRLAGKDSAIKQTRPRARLPEPLRDELESLTRISRELRRDRELAFYGAEDLTPSGFYSEADASRARDGARLTVGRVKPHVVVSGQDFGRLGPLAGVGAPSIRYALDDQPEMRFESGDVTGALIAIREGDDQAFDRLVQMVYQDLRRIAHSQRRRHRDRSPLQTTALVNETYLRLVDQTRAGYRDRGHFFAAWARAMRHVLVDAMRATRAQKRGGDAVRVPLEEGKLSAQGSPELVLAVDEALRRLGQRDTRLQQIVECRFYAGFTEEETAEALSMSLRSVQRGWWKARAWLGAELEGSPR